MLSHTDVINILLDMKDYEKDGNRKMALKIAATCVNAVQLSLQKSNEHIEEQERIQMTEIKERGLELRTTNGLTAASVSDSAQTASSGSFKLNNRGMDNPAAS